MGTFILNATQLRCKRGHLRRSGRTPPSEQKTGEVYISVIIRRNKRLEITSANLLDGAGDSRRTARLAKQTVSTKADDRNQKFFASLREYMSDDHVVMFVKSSGMNSLPLCPCGVGCGDSVKMKKKKK